jgi:hypothetical protein
MKISMDLEGGIIMIAISKLKRVGIGKLPNQLIITLKIRNMDVLQHLHHLK